MELLILVYLFGCQYIRALDIPMDYTLFVQINQALQNLVTMSNFKATKRLKKLKNEIEKSTYQKKGQR